MDERIDASTAAALARSLRRRRPQRRRRQEPPDRLAAELCRRYHGGNARLRRKTTYWLLFWFAGMAVAEIAADVGLDESTIRGHLDDVEAGLRCLYGRPIGASIERCLGFE